MFRFRLQRILELREKREQARARELATAQHTHELATHTQERLTALREDSRAQVQAATGSMPRVGHLQQLGSVLEALDTKVDQASEAVVAADAEVQQARLILEAAARDRRVLDRLKERHADAWRAESVQRDRVAMDEIALLRFTRQHETPGGDAAASIDVTNDPPR